ncbi:hypothetical protein [Frateuria aurantia]|uniref:hypothetical protein n=1 Tax=Frateuria aurantia TaxID=81475 RepID=UPI001C261AB6|nr:hypothetical protein [Frateuria aurantia]
MAHRIYGHSIAYTRACIHYGIHLPFGWQKQSYAMTPDGGLWFRQAMYGNDFSSANVLLQDRHVFIHEMGHVWQHQHGQWVRLRGAFSWAAEYTYQPNKKSLTDYSLEQQASIWADFWLLQVYGIDTWRYHQQAGRIGKYRGNDDSQKILGLYQRIIDNSQHGRHQVLHHCRGYTALHGLSWAG